MKGEVHIRSASISRWSASIEALLSPMLSSFTATCRPSARRVAL